MGSRIRGMFGSGVSTGSRENAPEINSERSYDESNVNYPGFCVIFLVAISRSSESEVETLGLDWF